MVTLPKTLEVKRQVDPWDLLASRSSQTGLVKDPDSKNKVKRTVKSIVAHPENQNYIPSTHVSNSSFQGASVLSQPRQSHAPWAHIHRHINKKFLKMWKLIAEDTDIKICPTHAPIHIGTQTPFIWRKKWRVDLSHITARPWTHANRKTTVTKDHTLHNSSM